MRVLAVGYKTTTSDKKSIKDKDIKGLEFLGLIGMIDPPREGVEEAIKKAHMAGIRVLMTTGDHKQTAIAIAKQIGLTRKDKKEFPIAYTEQELLKLSDREFNRAVENVNIFARLTPSMKFKINDTLQKKGDIVAMTGDGVNDAPALRKADIGIAMGIAGTDVARESSDIILRDDNFASIVNAIEEGRTIFTNIRQSLSFLITTNSAEFLSIFISLILGLPLPLLPTQVLWLNLITDSLPGISLATERSHTDILKKPPRNRNEEIISRDMIPFLIINTLVMTTLTFGAFVFFLDMGEAKARTAAFIMLAFTQLFNVFNMRSFKNSVFEIGIFSNKYVNYAFLISSGLSIIVIFNPFLKKILQFNGLAIYEFVIIIAISSLVLWFGEGYKLIKRKYAI